MQPNDPRLFALRDALAGQVLRGTGGVVYHLRERIGEGGQGWVFRAHWDEPDGLMVIVKVLRPDAVTPETLARFQREAEVLRMLGQKERPNPHIVRFFDHAVAEVRLAGAQEPLSLPFTVLEYVHGPTLEQVLAQSKGGLPADRARRILRQVVLALEHVHAQKVVHRDLKPSNILLAADAGSEVAKVTDFGLVKLVDVNLQKTTALAGASLGYAPPEQYEQGNQRVSPRTDVFSLTAILFEMLTGRPAFPYRHGENPLLIVTRILNGPRPQLAASLEGVASEIASRPDVVERLDAHLLRGTSPDPADRHESVTELWNALEPIFRIIGDSRRSYTPAPLSIPLASDTQPTAERLALADTSSLGARGSVAPPHTASGPRGSTSPSSAPGGMSGNTDARSRRDAPSQPPSEAQSANPAAWRWRVKTPSVAPGALRAAAFSDQGDVVMAIGPKGLARWESRGWTALPLPHGLDARLVRGLHWGRASGVVLYGERAFAARVDRNGALETFAVPDREVTFLGAFGDDDGTSTFVGDRPVRQALKTAPWPTMGIIAQVQGGKLTLLADAPKSARLRATTRLRSGTLLACGDWGALVRLELGVPEHVGAVCAGHLTAIAACANGGALTVGAGGHALSISPRFDAQLEAVQTTRDLLSLAIGEDGAAWAGAAQSRVLRRSGGSWVRMSGEVGVTAAVVAVWANAREVRAICDDGAVIEGVLA
jgi:serine/threonine protein kinase